MDVLRQDGGAQPPAGLPFDHPPAWNRALCRFNDAERRRFRGRSIRMELDLNGRLQAVVTIGLPPFRDRTEGPPAPAATRVRVLSGGAQATGPGSRIPQPDHDARARLP